MLGRWRTTVLLGISTAAPDWPEQWQCRCRASGSALERLRGGRREKMTGYGQRAAGRGFGCQMRRGGWAEMSTMVAAGRRRQPGFARSADEKKKPCGWVCSVSAGFSRLFNVGPPKFCRWAV